MFLLRHRFSSAYRNRVVDPIVVIMRVFDPVVPFIIATFCVRLLASIGLSFGSCCLPQNAVSAPLGEACFREFPPENCNFKGRRKYRCWQVLYLKPGDGYISYKISCTSRLQLQSARVRERVSIKFRCLNRPNNWQHHDTYDAK